MMDKFNCNLLPFGVFKRKPVECRDSEDCIGCTPLVVNGRAVHYVLRTPDRKESIRFFRDILGMKVLRHEEFSTGCGPACKGFCGTLWSKTMVGYGPEDKYFAFELAYSYSNDKYASGNSFCSVTIKKSECLKYASQNGWPIREDNVLVAPGGYKFLILEESIPKYLDPIHKVTLASTNIKRTVKYYNGVLGMSICCLDHKKRTCGFSIKDNAPIVEFQEVNEDINHADSFGRIAFTCPVNQLSKIERTVVCAKHTITSPLQTVKMNGKDMYRVIVLADPDEHEICFYDDISYKKMSRFNPEASNILDRYIDLENGPDKSATQLRKTSSDSSQGRRKPSRGEKIKGTDVKQPPTDAQEPSTIKTPSELYQAEGDEGDDSAGRPLDAEKTESDIEALPEPSDIEKPLQKPPDAEISKSLERVKPSKTRRTDDNMMIGTKEKHPSIIRTSSQNLTKKRSAGIINTGEQKSTRSVTPVSNSQSFTTWESTEPKDVPKDENVGDVVPSDEFGPKAQEGLEEGVQKEVDTEKQKEIPQAAEELKATEETEGTKEAEDPKITESHEETEDRTLTGSAEEMEDSKLTESTPKTEGPTIIIEGEPGIPKEIESVQEASGPTEPGIPKEGEVGQEETPTDIVYPVAKKASSGKPKKTASLVTPVSSRSKQNVTEWNQTNMEIAGTTDESPQIYKMRGRDYVPKKQLAKKTSAEAGDKRKEKVSSPQDIKFTYSEVLKRNRERSQQASKDTKKERANRSSKGPSKSPSKSSSKSPSKSPSKSSSKTLSKSSSKSGSQKTLKDKGAKDNRPSKPKEKDVGVQKEPSKKKKKKNT